MDGMDAMGGGHAGHDHSAHDKYHGSVRRLPDGSYTYTHGAFLGHMVPGVFFLAWGTWWAVCTIAALLRALAERRPFRARAWHPLPCGPRRLRALPLEPFIKLLLPAAGILGELWLGHESYRRLYADDGKFYVDNLNDWQHSAMYSAFMLSGAVDLAAHWLGAPPGTELAFLGLAFLSEGLLLVLHLKGPRVEVLAHLILVLVVFATVLATLAEAARPASALAAAARPWLTLLQGAWWIQTAHIMYTAAPQWDPDYMGSGMFAPVPFVLTSLGTALALLALLLAMKAATEWRLGRRLSFDAADGGEAPHLHQRLPCDEPAAEPYGGSGGGGGHLELGSLVVKQ